jgi:hypothetical protein
MIGGTPPRWFYRYHTCRWLWRDASSLPDSMRRQCAAMLIAGGVL